MREILKDWYKFKGCMFDTHLSGHQQDFFPSLLSIFNEQFFTATYLHVCSQGCQDGVYFSVTFGQNKMIISLYLLHYHYFLVRDLIQPTQNHCPNTTSVQITCSPLKLFSQKRDVAGWYKSITSLKETRDENPFSRYQDHIEVSCNLQT